MFHWVILLSKLCLRTTSHNYLKYCTVMMPNKCNFPYKTYTCTIQVLSIKTCLFTISFIIIQYLYSCTHTIQICIHPTVTRYKSKFHLHMQHLMCIDSFMVNVLSLLQYATIVTRNKYLRFRPAGYLACRYNNTLSDLESISPD